MANQLFNILIGNGIANITLLYETKKKLKLMVKKGTNIISYDLNSDITVPLTFGNGTYEFLLCEQKSGNQYALKQRIVRIIGLENVDAYMTQSNTYVYFNASSSFYQSARSLKTLDKVWAYFKRNFIYDYIGAILTTRQKFGPPDLEDCWKKKKGTCYNLAALLTAMLRICGIPACLVIGKAGKNNHAWVEVNGKIYDPTKELQGLKKELTYIAERYY